MNDSRGLSCSYDGLTRRLSARRVNKLSFWYDKELGVFFHLRIIMANVTVRRMWIFETAVSVKMVITTYRILISTVVNVSRAFREYQRKKEHK